jgi:ribosomal-protein-alanine N-acetyltransferase
VSLGRIRIEAPARRREQDFLEAVRRSRRLHRNLVTPPSTADAFERFVSSNRREDNANFLVVLSGSAELVGVINVSNIRRGLFKSAFLGYYGFVPHVGRGLMREGLSAVISYAFRRLKLHRLEANIQPGNERSIALVRDLGFRLEGYSPKYLKISGRWRDHERWAILAEEWRGR